MKIQSILQSIRGGADVPRRALHPLVSCLVWLLLVVASVSAKAQGVTTAQGSTPTSGGASLAGGNFTHGDQAYRVVRATDYTTLETLGARSEAGSITQTGWLLGSNHGDADCDGACTSCAEGSHFAAHGGGHLGSFGGGNGSCLSCGKRGARRGGGSGSMFSCPSCEPYWYGSFEALYMERTGSRGFSVSPDFFISKFGFDEAARLTVGYVPDCVQGYEVSFTGPLTFNRLGVRLDPDGGIRSSLLAVSPLDPSSISAFNNATAQGLFYEAEYWSVEASNTMVGWDVAKLICGIRYIDYEEDAIILSRNITDQAGFLRSNIDNRLLGFQVGMDLLFPICQNTYTDFRGRAGVYANFIDWDFIVVNDGSVSAFITDTSTKLAGQFEVGTGVRHFLTECFSVRAGVELWYFAGMASAKDQFTQGIPARYTIRAKDDFVMAGLNVGCEFRY